MYDLIVLGEALIDLISDEIVEDLDQATGFRRFMGGQVTNLAANVARLGRRVAIAACVGEDGFGRYIRDRLDEGDVDTEHLQSTKATHTTFSIIARQTGTPDFIIARGADSQLENNQTLEAAVAGSRLVHTSAFGLSREPARSTILNALNIAREKSWRISLDPNYHPRIWPDVDDFLNILVEVYRLVDITKPSLDDCERLFGPGQEPMAYAGRFLDWGCQIVALTMGAEGVLLATAGGERYHIHSSQVPVADITGAGDAFWAGFLVATLDGASPLEAARTGQALAEAKVGIIGPMDHLSSGQELTEYFQRIRYDDLT